MGSPKMELEKNLGKNNEQSIDSISYRTRTNTNTKCGKTLKTLVSACLVLLVVPHQSPPPLSVTATATPRYNTLTNVGRRRCIGQFLTSYATNGGTNKGERQKGKNPNGSVLHWLNENTSCDLPSEYSVPSRKRKKKDTNKSNGSEIDSKTPTFDEEDHPYHVVILLMENQNIHEEVITLSSGFLVAGLEVTIFNIFQDDGTLQTNRRNERIADFIQSKIFQILPTNDTIIQRAQDSFRFIQLNLNDYTTSKKKKTDNSYTSDPAEIDACMNGIAASHPLDKCAIEMAPSVLKLLLNETVVHFPTKTRGNDEPNGQRFDFVLMMDASFLGGLLFSEIEMIPSIVIGSHHSLVFAVEQEPKWSPSPNRKILDRMDSIFLQRLYSLGLTGVFLRANQMRHSLGMKRLKAPLDHFAPVVSVLVDLIPRDITFPLSLSLSSAEGTSLDTHSDGGSKEILGDDDIRLDEQGYGYRVHNMQPLLSPCTICLDQGTSRKIETNSSVIMVHPPAGVSAKWTRSLIRALSLTKQSLEAYDDCLFDRATCRNGVVGFEVFWLAKGWEEDDHFPPVAPSFIHKEITESLLDSAIRNPNTMIALIHCDLESSSLTTFGIEVFCISQSDRVPTIGSVGDTLYEKGYEDVRNDMDSSSKLLRESLSRENINPEEVATQLLIALRRKSIGSERSSTTEELNSIQKRNIEVANWVTSGLQRAMIIVQSAAQLHRENIWENPRQMQRATSSAITKALHTMDLVSQGKNIEQVNNNNKQDFGAKQNLDYAFVLFLSWFVFLSAVIFIVLKDSVVIRRWRQYRHQQYYRSGGNMIDLCLNRLDDLEKAWDMLLSWSSEFSTPKLDVDSDGDHIGRPRSNENPVTNTRKEHQPQNNSNNNHQYGQMRRRRKTKVTR